MLSLQLSSSSTGHHLQPMCLVTLSSASWSTTSDDQSSSSTSCCCRRLTLVHDCILSNSWSVDHQLHFFLSTLLHQNVARLRLSTATGPRQLVLCWISNKPIFTCCVPRWRYHLGRALADITWRRHKIQLQKETISMTGTEWNRTIASLSEITPSYGTPLPHRQANVYTAPRS